VSVAASNIGYVTGYYDDEVARRWFDAVPEVTHPIFGRRRDVTAEEAFEAGMKLAEEWQNKEA
jgi:hypothetical protein